MRFKQVKKERRRYSRCVVGGRFVARITPIHDAALIDLSPTGALIEHIERVQPGTTLFLTLSLLDNGKKKMGLRCKIVRSTVHRSQVASNGQRDMVYRTGIEFIGTLQPLKSHAAATR